MKDAEFCILFRNYGRSRKKSLSYISLFLYKILVDGKGKEQLFNFTCYLVSHLQGFLLIITDLGGNNNTPDKLLIFTSKEAVRSFTRTGTRELSRDISRRSHLSLSGLGGGWFRVKPCSMPKGVLRYHSVRRLPRTSRIRLLSAQIAGVGGGIRVLYPMPERERVYDW